MQVIENIFSHYCNARDDTYTNKYNQDILKKRTWPEQAANLYENLPTTSN